MTFRKNTQLFFSCVTFFILLSCSKSDHQASPYILNAYTYTVTDTTGINHTYSDTAKLNPDGSYYFLVGNKVELADPVAFVWQPPTNNINRYEFFFSDPRSGDSNKLAFPLPYFQSGVSGTNNPATSLIILISGGVDYSVTQPQPSTGSRSDPVYLANFSYSTNISDSTGGYITGSFNFSATTIDSGKIKISGQFTNLPTTFKP